MAEPRTESMAEARTDPAAGLWRHRNFNTFWLAQCFDFLGDSVAAVLMPLLVFEATGSVSRMGLVSAATGAGMALAGVFSGNLIDRVDRRRLMVVCDLCRAGLYAVIPLAWLGGAVPIGLLFPVAVGAALMTGCFLITYTTVTPRLVDAAQFAAANGRLQASIAVSYVAGPLLAGLGAQLASAAPALLGVVACYLISAAVMVRVRLGTTPVGGGRAFAAAEFLAGVRFLWATPVLRAVTVLFAAFTLTSTAAIDLFVYYLSHDLGRSRMAVGVAFGIGAVGAVLGGALTPVLRRRVGFGPSFLGALAVQAVALLAMGLAPGLAPVTLLITLFSAGFTLRNASTMTIRHQLTPDALMGRASAAFWALGSAAIPIGTTLATRGAASYGVPVVFAVMGLLGLVVAAVGMTTAARGGHQSQLARYGSSGR